MYIAYIYIYTYMLPDGISLFLVCMFVLSNYNTLQCLNGAFLNTNVLS